MVGRVPDQNTGRRDGAGAPEAERPGAADRPSGTGQGMETETGGDAAEKAEREKAETDIAAGDVADDLADFA